MQEHLEAVFLSLMLQDHFCGLPDGVKFRIKRLANHFRNNGSGILHYPIAAEIKKNKAISLKILIFPLDKRFIKDILYQNYFYDSYAAGVDIQPV